jgi:hypothetical protein
VTQYSRALVIEPNGHGVLGRPVKPGDDGWKYFSCRHHEVLAVLHGKPRRMATGASGPSFETPRKRAAPQDDEEWWIALTIS